MEKFPSQNSEQEFRVHCAQDSHHSISVPMFDFEGEEQVTIEQDSPRNDEDEDDQETHQKGYRFIP